MKKTKIFFAVAAIAAVLAMSVAFAACGGGVTLPEGNYSGEYKVTHTATVEESNFFTGTTVEKTVNYWGVKVGFTVDEENTIWNITISAADSDDVCGEEGYYANMGASFDASKFPGSIGGHFTIDDMMTRFVVPVEEDGFPKADEMEVPDGVTVPTATKTVCALAILCIQDTIEANAEANA